MVFTAARAVELAAEGEPVILVRRETNPDDLPGMIAAQGILTTRGGKTSHAAVVARGMGKTCVCGADAMRSRSRAATRSPSAGTPSREGDIISIDGTTGQVYLGEVPVRPSEVVQYFEGTLDPDAADDPLVAAVHRIIDARRRSAGGWPCAPTPTPARTPPGPGASAPRASACAAPSTCSSATAGSWSNG